MYESAAEFFEKRRERVIKVRNQAPSVAKAFAQMEHALMQEGAISAKVKELIAVGIGVAEHCLPCIRAHVAAALQEGASREEIIEAAGVAVALGGGPAYIHLPAVVETLEELEDRPAD